jgi:hypothetical protein
MYLQGGSFEIETSMWASERANFNEYFYEDHPQVAANSWMHLCLLIENEIHVN